MIEFDHLHIEVRQVKRLAAKCCPFHNLPLELFMCPDCGRRYDPETVEGMGLVWKKIKSEANDTA